MRYLLIVFVLFFISCKRYRSIKDTSEKSTLLIQNKNLKVTDIIFDDNEFNFIVSLSNNTTYEFEALELLFNSDSNFKKIGLDSFEFSNGDHYGNHITMLFNFDKNNNTLYLKEIEAFFPFKQDTLGRNKYCKIGNLNRDIRYIDSEKLFNELNTNKYCKLK